MLVLGIETSCDETAVAVIACDAAGEGRRVLAARVLSQDDAHAAFGGVVPELAARAHLEALAPLVAAVWEEVPAAAKGVGGAPDAVAATLGPGLVGGLLVGAGLGRGLALGWGCRFLGVHHLAAHALVVRLGAGESRPAFPYLTLLVSGGHCQLLEVSGCDSLSLLGETRDDAAGEALDKAARLLGLGWPGGPALERAAAAHAARHAAAAPALSVQAVSLPRPLAGRAGFDFSFSGLKTALARARMRAGEIDEATRDAWAFAFQAAVVEHLASRTASAYAAFLASAKEAGDASVAGGVSEVSLALVAAGGVAANRTLRARLEADATAAGGVCLIAPPRLCTDNAEMVAWAACERLVAEGAGTVRACGFEADFDLPVRPRWPLAELAGGAPQA